MSPDAMELWYWVTTRVDDFQYWCGQNDNRGPTYPMRVTHSVWQEIKERHNQTVFVDRRYTYKILPGQYKRDGRGVQGNVQLFDSNRRLCMNLHIPLFKQEKVVDDDGWTSIVKPKYRKK